MKFSVANSEPAQMPIENLAKIFGPTVLGYSCADPDHHAILSETMVQKDVNDKREFDSLAIDMQLWQIANLTFFFQVMENLLKIPADYWMPFIDSPPKSASSKDSIFGKIQFNERKWLLKMFSNERSNKCVYVFSFSLHTQILRSLAIQLLAKNESFSKLHRTKLDFK